MQLPTVIRDAFNATNSDFYVAVDTYDKWVLDKFTREFLNSYTADSNEQVWLDSLPGYVLPDVLRSIRKVNDVNRRMNRDMGVVPIRYYKSPSSVSHRKARA